MHENWLLYKGLHWHATLTASPIKDNSKLLKIYNSDVMFKVNCYNDASILVFMFCRLNVPPEIWYGIYCMSELKKMHFMIILIINMFLCMHVYRNYKAAKSEKRRKFQLLQPDHVSTMEPPMYYIDAI